MEGMRTSVSRSARSSGMSSETRSRSAPAGAWVFMEEPRLLSQPREDRKSTRLNSSHLVISYAVFCLKKKKQTHEFIYRHCISAALSVCFRFRSVRIHGLAVVCNCAIYTLGLHFRRASDRALSACLL